MSNVLPNEKVITLKPEPVLLTSQCCVRPAESEFYRVIKVRGDGRCMFRSLAICLAHLKKEALTAEAEERDADQLRLAVAEQMCRTAEKRKAYPEAMMAIKYDMGLQEYCKRILDPGFWGGESELLVLSRMLKRRIIVYIPASKAKNVKAGVGGFVPIQVCVR